MEEYSNVFILSLKYLFIPLFRFYLSFLEACSLSCYFSYYFMHSSCAMCVYVSQYFCCFTLLTLVSHPATVCIYFYCFCLIFNILYHSLPLLIVSSTEEFHLVIHFFFFYKSLFGMILFADIHYNFHYADLR